MYPFSTFIISISFTLKGARSSDVRVDPQVRQGFVRLLEKYCRAGQKVTKHHRLAKVGGLRVRSGSVGRLMHINFVGWAVQVGSHKGSGGCGY